MAGSIIQKKKKECFLCWDIYGEHNCQNLQCHHIFGGANRQLSEKYGLKVWLCREHHQGDGGVHFNKDLMQYMHEIGQISFEMQKGTREEFMQIFGKNYL